MLHDSTILAAMDKLKLLFPDSGGLRDTTYQHCRDIPHNNKPGVQIIHIKPSHWICISTLTPGLVLVADSLTDPNNPTNAAIRAVLDNMDGPLSTHMEDRHIQHIHVPRQKGFLDCGLFAIAYATAWLYGLDPGELTFDQPSLRTHLATWLTTTPATAPTPFLTANNLDYNDLDPACKTRIDKRTHPVQHPMPCGPDSPDPQPHKRNFPRSQGPRHNGHPHSQIHNRFHGPDMAITPI